MCGLAKDQKLKICNTAANESQPNSLGSIPKQHNTPTITITPPTATVHAFVFLTM